LWAGVGRVDRCEIGSGGPNARSGGVLADFIEVARFRNRDHTKEVSWDQIVKGYEYEKGKFVVLKEEDFARADVEATQTVDIINFVKIDDVDPLLFYKPYYLEVRRGGQSVCAVARFARLNSQNRDSQSCHSCTTTT